MKINHLEKQKKNRVGFYMTVIFSLSVILTVLLVTSDFLADVLPAQAIKITETQKLLVLFGINLFSFFLLIFFISKSKFHRYKHLESQNSFPEVKKHDLKRMILFEFLFNVIVLFSAYLYFPFANYFSLLTYIIGGLFIEVALILCVIKWLQVDGLVKSKEETTPI